MTTTTHKFPDFRYYEDTDVDLRRNLADLQAYHSLNEDMGPAAWMEQANEHNKRALERNNMPVTWADQFDFEKACTAFEQNQANRREMIRQIKVEMNKRGMR